MNTMEGECSLAREKSWDTSFSLSPIHLDTRSEEDTVKKVDSASVATACREAGSELRGKDLSQKASLACQ